MRNFRVQIECVKVLFHGLEKLPIFQFLAKPEKTALHLCLFPKKLAKLVKIWKFCQKSENRAYNKKIHTKMTIL